MTTPVPPGGNIPTSNVGGLIGNLLGGASGSLGGTNLLQASLDQLTNAVNSLANRFSGAVGGIGGLVTRQQQPQVGPNGARPFPRMVNQFQTNQPQPGIGGGGTGGAGNITPPNPFSTFASTMTGPAMMLGAVARFGQAMMPNQLMLNQYATTSMMGIRANGMSQGQAMKALYAQAGAMPGSQSSLAMSPMDMYGAVPYLQQLGGTRLYNQSALGRAGFGAMAGFGISNPTLGAQSSAQLAGAMYSPSFSMRMMQMGYNPIRSMNGGAPMNSGQAAYSILSGMGLGKMNPARVYGNLASPKGQVDLSYLFGQSGIPNDVAAQYLQTYSQLFSKGMNPTQASNLINKATFGSTKSMKAAQGRLGRLGVKTSTNDIQQLKNAQAVVSGRQGEYAGGFNTAIGDSTTLLEDFNNSLNKLLNGPLGTAAGYAGGTAGVMSGAQRGAGMGLGFGGALTIARLFGLGGGAGGAGASLFGRGAAGMAGGTGAAGTAGGAGVLTTIGATIGAAAGLSMVEAFTAHIGSVLGGHVPGVSKLQKSTSWLGKGVKRGLSDFAMQMPVLGPAISMLTGHNASMGGGAGSVSTSRQQGGNNNKMAGAGVPGSAKQAVGAAETQLGVPYVYGDEIPGVGFDCSGLVQWAYKQAGVNLPRTSQSMWSALKKRRVPLNAVQEGDLLFSAGSDGTASSPGHVAMMAGNHQIIQAPHTGSNVQLTGYNPREWVAAARPAGSGSFISGGPGSGPGISGTGTGSSSLFAGNRGSGMGSAGNYGSANEVDIISAMGSGGGGGGSFIGGTGNNGGSNTGNSNGTSGKAGSVGNIRGGGSIAANKKLMRQMAQAMYGWGRGAQWRALDTLEMHEAGYNQFAQNPTSTAFGMGQFLDSTWKGYGPKTTDPKNQIKYMLEYIHGRYGSPVKAWNQYYDHPGHVGWYGKGGTLGQGVSIVGERGPEIAMTSGGQTHIFSNAQSQHLINSLKGNVPQNPWKTDMTSGSGNSSSSHSRSINIDFKPGSIVIHSTGTESVASKSGREVARQIVKHVNHEAVHQAIRNGEKL